MSSQQTTVALLLLLGPGAGWAYTGEETRRGVLPGETSQVQSRLRLADELARKHKWAEAIDEYQRLIREAGDALVPIDQPKDALSAVQRSVQLRRLCHSRLAGLPPPALDVYRRRADPQARRWLEEGARGHDPGPLRRVIEEAFCSRFADQALDLLGDLAFERGEFVEARHWWRLLALPASEADKGTAPGELRFPDPTVDVARTRAKQVLALLFQGDLTAAEAELDAFTALHPQATGHLAGRDGNLAAILKEWLRRPPPFPENDEWPTFAGSPTRNRVLPTVLPRRLWAEGPTWRVRLDTAEGRPAGAAVAGQRPSSTLARRLACYPIIVENQVLVAGPGTIQAFDLASGRLLFHYFLPGGEDLLGKEPDQHHTLTAADGRVYACMGATAPQAAAKGKGPLSGSFLVCLDLHAADKKHKRWVVKAGGKADQPAFFGGAPVVRSGGVFVAVRRPGEGRTKAAIACYDADTGALRWEQVVCEVAESAGSHTDLLTLAGTQLVYCSDAGIIVALDPATGKLGWGVRYPGRPFSVTGGGPSPRDLAPAVYADNRLFLAPADTNNLFCLELETGRTLWERDGIEAVHLLGVSHGRLVFTAPTGIRSVGARTGDDKDGWLQPLEGRLRPCGRGLFAGGWVFWPVRDSKLPLRALNVADGNQWRDDDAFEPTQLRNLRPGNMAYGKGTLVVGGLEELVGYAPSERSPEKPKNEAAPGAVIGAPAIGKQTEGWQHAGQPQKAGETWQARAGWPIPTTGKAAAFFSACEDHLLCHEPDTGALRWVRQLAVRPSWVGCHADRVLVVGATGVESLRLEDGQSLWVWRAEELPISEPRLTPAHVVFLEAGRRLVALDLDRGVPAWTCWAPSARLLPENGGQFQRRYHAGEDWVILQTTGGNRLVLNSHTGQKVHEAATAKRPWPLNPLSLGVGRYGIVESARRVLLLDAATGKEIWTWKPRWPTSLTGAPPRLFGNRDGLFLVVPRNLGYDLERLDPNTGTHVWPTPVLLGDDPVNGEAVVTGKKEVYYARRGTLTARALADGKRLWERPLPVTAPRWRLAWSGRWLIAWPLEMDWGLRWGWLPAGELAVAFPLRAALGRPFPVLWCDPADGKQIQRHDFATAVPKGTVQLFPGRLVVAVPGRTWGLPAPAEKKGAFPP